MILLQELDNFFGWYAAQDPFIQHEVNGRKAYARTQSEAEQGNRSTLDFPRMEMLQLPNSRLNENNAEYEWEDMSVTLRVITKNTRNNWDEEREAMDDCKAALARMLKYITDTVKSGECCETDLLCLFDLTGSTIDYIDKATSGGDFVGARLRLQLKKDFNVDAVVSGNYPPLYALDENSVKVWDVIEQKFVWVAISALSGIQQESDPIFSAWLATNPIPVIPTNVSAFVNDAGYLTSLPSHNHNDIYYTESEVDNLLSDKSNVGHNHAIADVLGLQAALNAKQNTLTYTPEDSANKNQPNGYAGLDNNGLIPQGLLPSYVDDVLEFANLAAFPVTGETGKIYLAIDTGKIYRWTGTLYLEINASPGSSDEVVEGSLNLYFTVARVLATLLSGLSVATGGTIVASDSILSAFGKLQNQITTAVNGLAAHILDTANPHNVTKAQLGLGNVPNVDTTNPENISQNSNYRFVTDAEKNNWNANTIGSWTTYNPSPGGFSTLLDSRASYMLMGKLCHVKVIAFGTSNSGNTTFQLPFLPANTYSYGAQVQHNIPCYGINNNSGITSSASVRLSNSITASVFTNMTGNSWYNLNQKGFFANFFYEIE